MDGLNNSLSVTLQLWQRPHKLAKCLRMKIVKTYKECNSSTTLSQQFEVFRTAVQYIIKKYDEIHTVETLPRTGRNRKISLRFKKKIVRD